MKRVLTVVFCSLIAFSSSIDAKGGGSGGGGHSSGGGGKGGFSSSSGRPSAAPSAAPRAGAPSAAAPSTRSTTTTTTTTSRSYSYNSPYVGGGMMYGGWGMGYGYSNGLLTGMIIANMMHPHGTVMYTGAGQYSNNALLYPDGSVVNQQGYLVGNYVDGVYTPVQNGGLVAKPVPADANGTPVQQVQPQQVAKPIVIQNPGPSAGEVLLGALLIFGIFILLIAIIT